MNRRGELLKTNRNMSGQNLTEEEGRWVDVFVGLIIGRGGGAGIGGILPLSETWKVYFLFRPSSWLKYDEEMISCFFFKSPSRLNKSL